MANTAKASDVPDIHNVDVDIQKAVLDAAKARLALINKEERARYGVVRTSLADVGRTILADWKPGRAAPNRPAGGGTMATREGVRLNARGRRQFGAKRETRPLRFTMALATYSAAMDLLNAHGMNVTRALDEGLERFARTGKV